MAEGDELSSPRDKDALKLDRDAGCPTLNILKTTELYTLKG